MEKTKLLNALAILAFGYSCTWQTQSLLMGLDFQPISIATLNLFDQRIPYSKQGINVSGDWLFRRARLTLVDQQLRRNSPDLAIFQDGISRESNDFDSDQEILSRGALTTYLWSPSRIRSWNDTNETQWALVSFKSPITGYKLQTNPAVLNLMGDSGYLQVSELMHENQKFLVVNVKMPEPNGQGYTWYRFLSHQIRDHFETGTCRARIIVAGYLPTNVDTIEYTKMLDELELVDAAKSGCISDNDICATESPTNNQNQIFFGNEEPKRSYRILTSKHSTVNFSSRCFGDSTPNNLSGRLELGESLWASPFAGWCAKVKLRRC